VALATGQTGLPDYGTHRRLVDRTERGSMKVRWRVVTDRIWPTLEHLPSGHSAPLPAAVPEGLDETTLRFLHEERRHELAAEVDRLRVVESKLTTIMSVGPIPITLLLGVVAFLSSGRAQEFTPVSVIVIATCAFYVALQFLRAILAAIQGLSRTSYPAPFAAAPSRPGADPESGCRDACEALAKNVHAYRERTNAKVDQLELAYTSIINAVVALILAIGVLAIVVVFGSVCRPSVPVFTG
jgi:hypothetical protein